MIDGPHEAKEFMQPNGLTSWNEAEHKAAVANAAIRVTAARDAANIVEWHEGNDEVIVLRNAIRDLCDVVAYLVERA